MGIKCNICGGNKFGFGPGGRLSTTGKKPRCDSCQSLERHRTFRSVFELIRDERFADYTALQFSHDNTIEKNWFKSYEISIFGGDNTLDLQKIDRNNEEYDVVICNHILEHVEYDNAGLNELARIIKNDGFVFLSFPDPINNEYTRDWGYADNSQHGHYRIYGQDVVEHFRRYIPYYRVLSVIANDPVTKAKDLIYFICKSDRGIDKLSTKIPELEEINLGGIL